MTNDCSLIYISVHENYKSVVIWWVSCYENKCFRQRFTCTKNCSDLSLSTTCHIKNWHPIINVSKNVSETLVSVVSPVGYLLRPCFMYTFVFHFDSNPILFLILGCGKTVLCIKAMFHRSRMWSGNQRQHALMSLHLVWRLEMCRMLPRGSLQLLCNGKV